MNTVPDHLNEYWRAVEAEEDIWVTGCGGSETPFYHNGVRWLYVFNPGTGAHGFYNLSTDIVHDTFRAEEL